MDENDGLFAMQKAISVVDEQQDLMNQRVDKWTATLEAAIAQLSRLQPGDVPSPTRIAPPSGPAPGAELGRLPDLHGRGDITLPSPEPLMGNINSYLTGLDGVLLDEIPPAPQAPLLNIPATPSLVFPTAPGAHGIDTTVDIPTPPTLPTVELDGLQALPAGYTPSFTDIPDAPLVDWGIALPAGPDLDNPQLGGLTPAPTIYTPVVPVAPQRPNIDTEVALPDRPVYDLPQLRALKDVPDFEFPLLADFDGNPPTLELATPNVFINWAEPEYDSELLPDLVAWVRRYMQGGTGLPAHVEDALFSRARDRQNAETRRAVQEATSTWAGRGFSMPPGMLAKQVNVAQEEGRGRAAELNRDILVEAAKWEIDNIRFAVEKGIATEQLLQNLHENTVKRLFEVARFGAESQITLYNARIGLYNAQLSGFNALRDAFRMKLDRALAVLEVWKVRAQAATTHNQNVVEIFKAEYIAVQQSVETYKGLLDGARMQVSLIEAKLNIYRTDVQVHSDKVAVEKMRVEADDVRARAIAASNQNEIEAFKAKLSREQQNVEVYKALLDGARVRAAQLQTRMEAYRTEVQAHGEKNAAEKIKVDAADTLARQVIASNQNAVEVFKAKHEGVRQIVEQYKAFMEGAKTKASVIESQFTGYRAEVQAYAERVNAEKSKVDINNSLIQGEKAKADVFDAQTRAFSATVSAVAAKADAQIRGKQLKLEAARVRLAEFQTNSEIWRAKVDANLRVAANEIAVFQSEVEAWRAGATVNIANAEAQSRFADMQTRTNIAYAEMQMHEYQAKLQHVIQRTQVVLEALKSIGQYSAQLVAGAMSAINVSAGVSGSGSQSGSWSRNDNYNYEGN